MMKSESGSNETSSTPVMAENDRHRERLESERAREAARAESEHRERLAMYAAELEAKRRELAELEVAPTIESPGKRLLKWTVPVAATVLVAYFAMLAMGSGNDVGARAPASHDTLTVQAAEVAPEPIELAPAPVVEPEPVAVAPEPEPVKPTHAEHKQPKHPKNPKNPPLIVLDPNGDPLG
jgi:hypothetical protein